jgi:hypothetical protein
MIVKVMLLLTGGGPMVILTSLGRRLRRFIKELRSKGIDKFIVTISPLTAKERYGTHFATVAGDVHETDQLRILDFSGHRAFSLFRFDELGPPTRYEA